MSSDYTPEAKAAADALRAGRLDEAERRIDALLSADPDDVDALNLRGALRSGRKDHWGALEAVARAAALRPEDPRLALNHAAMLVNVGALTEALAAYDAMLARRPNDLRALHERGRVRLEADDAAGAVADLSRAVAIAPMLAEPKVSLAEAQLAAGDLQEALRLLVAAGEVGDDSARANMIRGRAMAKAEEYERAARAFERAIGLEPERISAYAGLAEVERRRGRRAEAQAATDKLLARAPLGERGTGGEITALVTERLSGGILGELRPTETPHALSNFIAQMPSKRIRYLHGFPEHDASRAAAEVALPTLGLIYNNWTNPDAPTSPDAVAALAALLARPDAPPVINAPAAVAATSRSANAETYADAERFDFPQTVLIPAFRRNGEARPLDPAARRDLALDALAFPILVRPTHTQRGAGAMLTTGPAELERALQKLEGRDAYAIAYHECGAADGIFRRYRMVVAGAQIMAANMHVAQQWNVHGAERGDFDWEAHGLRAEELAFVETPETLLDGAPDQVFAEVLARCPLDVYGIDFGVRREDGRIVVFEINASMSFTSVQLVRAYPHLAPHRDRMIEAIEALFLERARRV
ncbi:MAG: tetratricopeptide repeat protein [Pseudomonadota bacterium]